MKWLPGWHIQPGVYAMCAAAAMLGGVFRASISLVVLIVEGSRVRPLSISSYLPDLHQFAILTTWGLNLTPIIFSLPAVLCNRPSACA